MAQEHCVCVSVAGVIDLFFLMDPSVGGGSNLTLTLLSHALDVTAAKLRARGRRLPLSTCLALPKHFPHASETENAWVVFSASCLANFGKGSCEFNNSVRQHRWREQKSVDSEVGDWGASHLKSAARQDVNTLLWR